MVTAPVSAAYWTCAARFADAARNSATENRMIMSLYVIAETRGGRSAGVRAGRCPIASAHAAHRAPRRRLRLLHQEHRIAAAHRLPHRAGRLSRQLFLAVPGRHHRGADRAGRRAAHPDTNMTVGAVPDYVKMTAALF